MSKAKKSAGVQVPSEVEFVSNDWEKTTDYLGKALGWETSKMPDWKMGTAKWGLKTQAMIRAENEVDKGRSQRTIFYFTVPDIKAEYKRLAKLGASTLKEPNVVPGMGAWGYLNIPGDVILGLWQNDPAYTPPERQDTKKPGEDGTATFYEFIASDTAGLSSFLTKAYGWQWHESDFHSQKYWYFSDPSARTFSCGLRAPKKGEKDGQLVTFVNSSDSAKSTASAVKAGGKKVGTIVNYDPHGEYQLVNAPGNLSFGIWGQTEASRAHHGQQSGAQNGEKEDDEEEDGEEEKAAPKAKAAPKRKAAAPKANGRAKPAAKKAAAAPAAPKQGRKRAASTSKVSKKPAKRARK